MRCTRPPASVLRPALARKPPPTTSPDDSALFRDALGTGIKPLKDHGRTDARPSPPKPHPAQTIADRAAVAREMLEAPLSDVDLEFGEPLSYVRDGVAPRVLKRMGRGEFAVRDELDLHHMTADVAASALSGFLNDSRRAGRLCVKVIHGKGLRSKSEGPVLKRLVDRLLRRRGDVVAFRSARAVDGGSGAVIVLLRREP